jgi:hypothetical protein
MARDRNRAKLMEKWEFPRKATLVIVEWRDGVGLWHKVFENGKLESKKFVPIEREFQAAGYAERVRAELDGETKPRRAVRAPKRDDSLAQAFAELCRRSQMSFKNPLKNYVHFI